MAVVHQLLTIIFHIVRDGTVYQELGAAHFALKNKSKVTDKLIERLQKLGYYVTLQQIQPPLVNACDPAPPPHAYSRCCFA